MLLTGEHKKFPLYQFILFYNVLYLDTLFFIFVYNLFLYFSLLFSPQVFNVTLLSFFLIYSFINYCLLLPHSLLAFFWLFAPSFPSVSLSFLQTCFCGSTYFFHPMEKDSVISKRTVQSLFFMACYEVFKLLF